MRFLGYSSLALVAAVLVVSCAKKKEEPPRGKVLGVMSMTVALSEELVHSSRFNDKLHCIQKVELAKDGSQAVEITPGACPANNAIVKEPKVSFAINAIPKSAKRLHGEQHLYVKQAPVGTIVENEITDLCTFDSNLSAMCEVIASDKGIIELVAIHPDGFLKHIEAIQQAAAEDRQAREAREESLRQQIKDVETLLGDKEKQFTKAMSALEAQLKKEDARIDGELKNAIKKFEAAISMTNQLINDNNAKAQALIQKTATDAQTALKAVEVRIDAKDVELQKAINLTKEALEVLRTRVSTAETRLEKLAERIKTQEEGLAKAITNFNDSLKKLSDETKTLVTGEVAKLTTKIEELSKVVTTNKEATAKAIEGVNQSIDSLKKALEGKDAELENKLNDLKKEVGDIKTRLEKAEKDIVATNTEVGKANAEIAATKADVAKLTTKVADNDAAVKTSISKLSTDLTAAYKAEDAATKTAVDAKFKQVQDNATALAAEVAKGAKATDVNTKIDALTASLNSLKDDVTKGLTVTEPNKRAELKSQIDTAINDLAALKSNYTALANKQTALDTSFTTLTQDVGTRLTRTESDLASVGAEHAKAATELKKAVEALAKSDHSNHKAASEKLVQIVADLEAYAQAVKSADQAKQEAALAEAKKKASALKALDVSFDKAMNDFIASVSKK